MRCRRSLSLRSRRPETRMVTKIGHTAGYHEGLKRSPVEFVLATDFAYVVTGENEDGSLEPYMFRNCSCKSTLGIPKRLVDEIEKKAAA